MVSDNVSVKYAVIISVVLEARALRSAEVSLHFTKATSSVYVKSGVGVSAGGLLGKGKRVL